jgi:SAM-dependent methyltransferase
VRPEEAGYIHGTAYTEQARLAGLNRLTNREFVQFLGLRPGMRVLEVGSGLGLLAAEVAAAAAGVEVVGLERSPRQITAAIKAPNLRYVQGDAHELEMEDGAFDLVYARYVLEHVADPQKVVQEMSRVARPGGRVAVLENDISLLRLDPPCPAFEEAWRAFASYQASMGGDGYVGRRLFRLFRGAGLRRIELSGQPEMHAQGSPRYAPWLENLAGNLTGARAGLVEKGFCAPVLLDRALAELTALGADPDGSSQFCWSRASAVR